MHLHFIYSVPTYIPSQQNNAGFGSEPPTQSKDAYQPIVQPTPSQNSTPLNAQEQRLLQRENYMAERTKFGKKMIWVILCIFCVSTIPIIIVAIVLLVVFLGPNSPINNKPSTGWEGKNNFVQKGG